MLTNTGGGFIQPCTIGHMQYLHRLVTEINASGGANTIAVLLPAYTLAPEAVFPQQVKQAACALSYLLHVGKRSPSSILLGGDSAGGGLALSLLSHILHPREGLATITLSGPLRGVFLFSPWVSFSTTHSSFSRNSAKDALVPNMLRKWGALYLGSARNEEPVHEVTGGNNYSEPLLADGSWWKGMHEVVEEMFIWAGQDEIFVDGLQQFAQKLVEGWEAGGGAPQLVKSYIAPGEAHVGPIMDVMLQYKEKSRSQFVLEGWLKGRLA